MNGSDSGCFAIGALERRTSMDGVPSGQVVVVSGAGRGWGHSICRMMARHGTQVVGTSEVEAELEELRETVRDEGGEIEIDLAHRPPLQRQPAIAGHPETRA